MGACGCNSKHVPAVPTTNAAVAAKPAPVPVNPSPPEEGVGDIPALLTAGGQDPAKPADAAQTATDEAQQLSAAAPEERLEEAPQESGLDDVDAPSAAELQDREEQIAEFFNENNWAGDPITNGTAAEHQDAAVAQTEAAQVPRPAFETGTAATAAAVTPTPPVERRTKFCCCE